MSLEDALLKSLQGDSEAEKTLQSALLDLNSGLLLICGLLKTKQNAQLISGTGLLLKNIAEKRTKEYLAVNITIRNDIHVLLLDLLEFPTTAIAIAALATVEIENWHIVPTLIQIIQSPNSEIKKANALNCIGYICESIDPVYLHGYANPILTAVIYGANQESNKIKKASIVALNNSLIFIKDNFQVEGERNYIMETVCTCTVNKDADIRTMAFECLVKIMTLYYEFMEPYMKSALVGLTTAAMQYTVTHNDEQVALQAIEFWSSICDEELNIKEYQDKIPLNFAKNNVKQIVPMLTWLLTNCEDVDKEEWCIYTAAVTCLTLFAQLLGNECSNEVVPFIELNISSEDWKSKEAAVTAFGCILDGPNPEQIGHIVNSALPILINLINTDNQSIKETCIWVLGLICEKLLPYVHHDHYTSLINAFEKSLGFQEGVQLYACIGLQHFMQHKPPQSSLALSKTAPLLIQMAGMPTPNFSSRIRRAATTTLESYILNCPASDLQFIQTIGASALTSFNGALQVAIQMNDISEHLENMGCLIERCIARLGTINSTLVTRDMINSVMEALMNALVKIPEDCFRIFGTIVLVLKDDFSTYLNYIKDPLQHALTQIKSPSLLRNAIFLLSDIAKMSSQGFMKLFIDPLFQLLIDDQVDRHVKPVILTCLGDIAASLQSAFEPYLANIAPILQTAINIAGDSDADFTLELRQSTADCLTELYWAMKDKSTLYTYIEHILDSLVPFMVSFVCKCAEDVYVRDVQLFRSLLGLLQDILPYAAQNPLTTNELKSTWMMSFLNTCQSTSQLENEAKQIRQMFMQLV